MLARTNLPVSLVAAVRDVLVDTSVRLTVAPTTAPPDGSVTVPAIVPVETDCAITVIGLLIQSRNAKRKTPTILFIRRILDIRLPLPLALDIPVRKLREI
jgi:hypothetical protein